MIDATTSLRLNIAARILAGFATPATQDGVVGTLLDDYSDGHADVQYAKLAWKQAGELLQIAGIAACEKSAAHKALREAESRELAALQELDEANARIRELEEQLKERGQ